MKLSIVSTEVDIFSSSSNRRWLLSHRHIRLFSGSHTRTQKQNNSAEALSENTSCSSHTACPFTHQKLPSNSLMQLSCISSLTPRNFPVTFYEKKKTTRFSHVLGETYCTSCFQLSFSCKSPGYGSFAVLNIWISWTMTYKQPNTFWHIISKWMNERIKLT